METNILSAPYIDRLLLSCQNNPEVKNESNIKKLYSVFMQMLKLKKQGDDELRSIWISADRGDIDEFGDYYDFHEAGEVNNKEDFEKLWKFYYPDKTKWYNFTVATYSDVYYFYFDFRLTFQFNTKDFSQLIYDFQTELVNWLVKNINDCMKRIENSLPEYNEYINKNLPYKNRVGRILRRDFWTIFPEYQKEFDDKITPQIYELLEKVKIQSESKTFNYLSTLNAGDYYRFCEIAYDANNYFEKTENTLTSKEKYLANADGRDCGLRKLDENSNEDFSYWFKTGRNCGGHPWEICRGGNSTHISLYVCKDDNGWYLRLEGKSRARVIETILMAVALYQNKIPFILGNAEEIIRMAKGVDYIGIVPEFVVPRYCHSYFPAEDKIIDFMNLGFEKIESIIDKTFWYPIPALELNPEK
ncbi:MAG: hypothetical protein U0W24_22190 [Bacteroidales bacterium]